MVRKMVPMMPLPEETVRKIGERFRGVGASLMDVVPFNEKRLMQAGMDMNGPEYLGFSFFAGLFYGLLTTFLVALLSIRNIIPLVLSIPLGLLMFLITFIFVAMYPYLVVRRIARLTDRDMLAAMRHLLIEVRSGVPLYNAMVGITSGYGQVSKEFDQIVKDINAGTKEIVALNRAAERNTSLFFRRAIWQIVNAMRGGSDIGDTLESITDSFAQKQAVRIRRYGQELNPWTMIYMIVAVIVPSLGITFLVVLSSFIGLNIPFLIFPSILVGLIVFQFFFMGFIKKKRPDVSV